MGEWGSEVFFQAQMALGRGHIQEYLREGMQAFVLRRVQEKVKQKYEHDQAYLRMRTSVMYLKKKMTEN